MSLELTAAEDDDGRRLDRILRKALPQFPLSALHRLLRKGGVLVGGVPAGGERRLRAGETIKINAEENGGAGGLGSKPKTAGGLDGKALPDKSILYEGDGLLIINKEAGRLVHGKGSLEESVRLYLKDKTPPSLSFRPGPLHRLDRPTSGIIVFSSSLRGARYFSGLLRERSVRKRYLAIADGIIEKNETWEDLLVRDRDAKKTFALGENQSAEAKAAGSEVRPLAAGKGRTLIVVEIKTGRTHQIRSQAGSREHPLSGDRKYGGGVLPKSDLPIADSRKPNSPKGGGAFFLHAFSLEFPLPGAKTLSVKAPPPPEFIQTAAGLFNRDILQLLAEISPGEHNVQISDFF